MSNDIARFRQTERQESRAEKANALRTLGWIAILSSALFSIWLWVGLREGSDLWLWLTLAAFAAGIACIVAGKILEKRSAAELAEDEDQLRAA